MADVTNVKKMIDSIINQATDEADEIISLAERAKERNLRPFYKRAEKIEKEIFETERKKIEQEFHSRIAEFDLDKNLAILNIEKKSIEYFKQLLFEKINAWIGTNDYYKVFTEIIKKLKTYLQEKTTVLLVNEKDAKKFNKLIVNNIKDIKVKIEISNDILGGFIIHNKQQNFILDYSIDNLFRIWFNTVKNDINKQLKI